MKVVLGSQSASRRQLLARLVPEFECLDPNIDEKAIRRADPAALTLALAHAKADALLPTVSEPALLITCDQVVLCQGEVREKPAHVAEARRFLESYSNGSPAQTVSAIVVTPTAGGRRLEGVDEARVFFLPIPQQVREELIAEGAVLRTAGGFLVEHPVLSRYIDRVEGSLESIMGLPLGLLEQMLQQIA